jgi:hypothetical protein
VAQEAAKASAQVSLMSKVGANEPHRTAYSIASSARTRIDDWNAIPKLFAAVRINEQLKFRRQFGGQLGRFGAAQHVGNESRTLSPVLTGPTP